MPHPTIDPRDTAPPLARAVLAYLAVVIGVITLAPLRFERVVVHGITDVWSLSDIVLNVLLFVPIGWMLQFGRPEPAVGRALAAGALFSGGIEVLQLFSPERYPSLLDLAANTLGAGLGAWAKHRGVHRGTALVAALQQPLAGLALLLVPLAWLGALGAEAGGRSLGAWGVLPAAAAAGWVLASLPIRAVGVAGTRGLLVVVAGWSIVALAPAAIRDPRVAAWAAAAAGLAAVGRSIAPERFVRERDATGGWSRRVERPALRVALALLTVTLLLAAGDAGAGGAVDWTVTWALLPDGAPLSRAFTFRVLAQVSGFAVIGFAAAEYLARARERAAAAAPLLVPAAGLLLAAVEAMQARPGGPGASASRAMLSVFAVLVGWRLYLLQLAHIRALVRAGRPTPQP